MEYRYSYGITSPRAKKVKIVKLKNKEEKELNIYFKDLDNKIKKVNTNEVDINFMKNFFQLLIKKVGPKKVAESSIRLYINKKEIEELPVTIKTYIDTEHSKEYFENPIQNLEENLLEENLYIPVCEITPLRNVNIAYELDRLTSKTITK